jgi:excisionase family DNA binding protein
MEEDIFTKKELADYLKVSVGTIDRMMKLGLPHLKLKGAVRFEKQKVISWLEKEVKE